jgi:hypothetical protein
MALVAYLAIFNGASLASEGAHLYIQKTVDATTQPPPARRGMGPTPHASVPGHTRGFLTRLEVTLRPHRTLQDDYAVIDFALTNIDSTPIRLPISVDQQSRYTHLLTFFITSPDGVIKGDIPPCAELYGETAAPDTFILLGPGKTLLVHASTHFALPESNLTLTGHAEYLSLTRNRADFLGAVESRTVRVTPCCVKQ